MLGLFGNIRGHLVISKRKVRVDNWVFRLHYRITLVVLIGACIVVTASQFIGTPISCFGDKIQVGQFEKTVNTYCWISSTFSVAKAFNKNARLGTEIPHPGVANYVPGEEEKVHHAYYQWVPFMLFLQAVMFYVPHYIWKIWEEGRLKNLMLGLDSLIMTEEEKDRKLETLVKYMMSHFRSHNLWFTKYVICEMLNFTNVVWQIFFTDIFLGKEFTRFGIEAMSHITANEEDRTDPLTVVFPRVTKCTWHMFGPSGTVQKYDALCVLAWNIMNEKIYVFLWFWFVILSILSGLELVYRLCTIVSVQFRARLLCSHGRSGNEKYAYNCVFISDKTGIGDWFLLSHLGKYMDPLYFGELVNRLCQSMDDQRSSEMATMKLGKAYA